VEVRHHDAIDEIPSSKRSSSEARLLLDEYSHRINNEFASAIGAISVAAAHSADNEAKAVLAAVQDQLQNYAQCTTPRNCCFSNMRLKQHSYVSAQQQFSTSGAFVLRYL
jgi:hypothetical protein